MRNLDFSVFVALKNKSIRYVLKKKSVCIWADISSIEYWFYNNSYSVALLFVYIQIRNCCKINTELTHPVVTRKWNMDSNCDSRWRSRFFQTNKTFCSIQVLKRISACWKHIEEQILGPSSVLLRRRAEAQMIRFSTSQLGSWIMRQLHSSVTGLTCREDNTGPEMVQTTNWALKQVFPM